MAITLSPDGSSDAELTDRIGLGDLAAAARLWVRLWPITLAEARRYVDAEEVPGLAAEALIGTVAAIAIGRGPREDVSSFVLAAVAELGDDDEPESPDPAGHGDVFVSALMTSAYQGLPEKTRKILWSTLVDGLSDNDLGADLGVSTTDAAQIRLETLTALQLDYLAAHTVQAETPACERAHLSMTAAAAAPAREGLNGTTWLHLSTCAWCTEAFHEVAFTTVALDALVDPAAVTRAAPAPPAVAPVAAPAAPVDPAPAAAADETVVFEPAAAAVAEEAAAAVESTDPSTSTRAAWIAFFRGRRGLALTGTVTAAALAVMAVLLLGSNGEDGPVSTAADASPTATAPETFGTTPTSEVAGPSTASPSATASLAESPAAATTSAAVVDAPTAAPSSATTPQPTATKKPSNQSSSPSSPKPTATSSSTPSAPASSPASSPTPTPTPTPRCNFLQHLVGKC